MLVSIFYFAGLCIWFDICSIGSLPVLQVPDTQYAINLVNIGMFRFVYNVAGLRIRFDIFVSAHMMILQISVMQ